MANVDTTYNGGVQNPEASLGIGSRAVNAVSDTAANVSDTTGEVVKKYPLASVGIAFAGGALLGAVAYRLLAPKPTWFERLGLLAVANMARNKVKDVKELF